MKDIFERVWDYQAKLFYIVIRCITSCSMTRNLAGNLCSSPSSQEKSFHVWFLDPVNTKDFFERFQDYQAK